MIVVVVIVGMATTAMLIGILRERLPWDVVRVGYLLGFATPVLGLADAIWELWHRWVGWPEITLLVVGYALTGVGITVGYHRYLAHRSFQTRPAVKAVLLVLGAMSMPSRPLDFAATHLQHHAHSDRDGDPHSPRDGLFHAHIGWTMSRQHTDRERYCRHLLDDRVVAFVDRTTLLWFGLGLLLPALIDGWRGFLWGGLVRMALQNHATFAVNSICHAFGSRPFETRDLSRNNLVIALWALGEGWHNNHHAFPSMAYHGIGWRQPDFSGAVIWVLGRLGLAWNIRMQPDAALLRRRSRSAPAAATAAAGAPASR